ncbi:MAG: 16S rRNA (guanine(527)-N(7))-methyltransferase RsmG [Planctomycetes bacterium]|nr:16S rRNA (guanine(527)-N(7))-methyltransferase RsmG [Planctomycetota bacterium]
MTDSPSLPAALAAHNIALPEDQIAQLADYCARLWDWNEKLNLTRHTDYEKFVARDVVDTLELSKALAADERVLDVGTGGGVPGVVLAIVRPDLHVALSESVGKKARAVADIVAGMKLSIHVHAGRAEDLLSEDYFDTLVARAVAPMHKLLRWFEPRWGSFGRLLLIKGPAWVEERSEARHMGSLRRLELRKVASWPVPGAESESVLLEIRPSESSGE